MLQFVKIEFGLYPSEILICLPSIVAVGFLENIHLENIFDFIHLRLLEKIEISLIFINRIIFGPRSPQFFQKKIIILPPPTTDKKIVALFTL